MVSPAELPPADAQLTAGELKISLFNGAHFSDSTTFERAVSDLELEELRRARSFHTKALARRWLIHRWLAKSQLAATLDTEVRLIRWQTRPSGKPIQPGLSFSLSHSGDYLAVAIAPDHLRLGVDCELIPTSKTAVNSQALLGQLHPSDRQQLEEKRGKQDSGETFLRLWTRLEAVGKATGTGLTALGSYPVGLSGPVRLPPRSPACPGEQVAATTTQALSSPLPILLSWASLPA